jgi:WhiB family redox-sensing transcriptional regulator
VTWQERAACRGMDPGLFFPEKGSTLQADKARAVCAGCPVRDQCLEAGRTEKYGVWGGLSHRERRALAARRRRAA